MASSTGAASPYLGSKMTKTRSKSKNCLLTIQRVEIQNPPLADRTPERIAEIPAEAAEFICLHASLRQLSPAAVVLVAIMRLEAA